MSKQAEREYALRVDPEVLYRKPYTSPRVFREFTLALELFQQLFTEGAILDLGCGSGWTSLLLARAGYEVVGVDIAERMVEVARARSIQENASASFHVADMEELELERRDFNGVLLFDCLHHCPRYDRVLQRAWEHLTPGGWLLLFETTWLHRYSPHARKTTEQYGVTELGFSRGQLKRALRQAGFPHVVQHTDPGPLFRGLGGFLWANLRLWCSYLACFPQSKNIFLAQK
jgi:SAM-dependent methyltransferase